MLHSLQALTTSTQVYKCEKTEDYFFVISLFGEIKIDFKLTFLSGAKLSTCSLPFFRL